MTITHPRNEPSPPPAPILEADGVQAGYGAAPVLSALTLRVWPGEIYALLGANGAGKTTTLSLFLGFVTPGCGRVRVNRVDPAQDPAGARRQIAYIPENVALYEHLSARENVAYLLSLAGQQETTPAIDDALQAAGLEPAAFGRRVAGFSKGMRQKVAIALALRRKVAALLLDEPTSGLDPQATAEFNRLLALLRAQGVATLMVTHDLLSAADIADRIGFIQSGRLAAEFVAQGPERFDVRALHQRYAQGAA
ncbi:ABC transporter ATP-binding protein [Cupriavidus sp. NPDC089707]|uniref:ABC transporter ATP-binding protein n=1 Tax=Cupriavidus sp. NPDC089707 TaxID=3363963 RepID=UPI003818F832